MTSSQIAALNNTQIGGVIVTCNFGKKQHSKRRTKGAAPSSQLPDDSPTQHNGSNNTHDESPDYNTMHNAQYLNYQSNSASPSMFSSLDCDNFLTSRLDPRSAPQSANLKGRGKPRYKSSQRSAQTSPPHKHQHQASYPHQISQQMPNHMPSQQMPAMVPFMYSSPPHGGWMSSSPGGWVPYMVPSPYYPQPGTDIPF